MVTTTPPPAFTQVLPFSANSEGLPVPEIIPEIIAEIKAKVAIRGRTCVHDFRNGCFDAVGG
jgi:hypothetical protein